VIRIVAVMVGILLSVGVSAHHSVAGFYNPGKSVEIDGIVKTVRWRNPHTVFEVEVTDKSGAVVTWRIESGALGVLRSRGIGREFIKAGDHVKIMGDSSIRSDQEMFARNILLDDGKEVMMTAGSAPYFKTEASGGMLESRYDAAVARKARQTADGIFRVWSTNIEEVPSSGGRMLRGDLPMNDAARQVRAQYNAADATLLGCTEWSMPRLMTNPLPMEFVRDGDLILQRFEENDNLREIHMQSGDQSPGTEYEMLGYSTGRWEGSTLVVSTTHVAVDRFDNAGTPFSEDMHLVERFTPSEDGSRLNYVLNVTDPKTFTKSFDVERYWIWRPEITVDPYDCDRDQKL